MTKGAVSERLAFRVACGCGETAVERLIRTAARRRAAVNKWNRRAVSP